MRRALAACLAAAVIAAPVGLAVSDRHLTGVPTALVVSTAAAALTVSALALQPVLSALGRIPWHRRLGALALVLVLVHVGGLMLVSLDDTLFAMSPDGPTRARMALFSLIALVLVVALGVGRRRLPMAGATWRILHGYLATVVIVLGVGHAILTDGALDGVGTWVLWGCGALGLLTVPAAFVARTRRAARAGPER